MLRLGPVGFRLVAAVGAAATAVLGVRASAAAEIIALVVVLAALIGIESRATSRTPSRPHVAAA